MRRRTVVNAALLAAGVALLLWQIDRTGGAAAVADGFRRVGFGFAPVLLLSLARFVLRSYSWLALLDRPAPLAAATAATISGDALGNLTPLGLAASEPAKAIHLGRHVRSPHALAALAAENFFYGISVALYVIVGAGAMMAAFDLPDNVRWAGAAALGLMASLLALAGWVAWQRPAAASALLSKIPIARLRAVIARVRDFETRAYGSAGHERTRLGAVALADASFHLVSFLESWLTLWLLTGLSLPLHALILDSVNRVINVVFKLVPMRVGVDEVGSEIVAQAIGLAPGVGLLTALVRRVRMLVFAFAGVLLWLRR